MSGFMMLPRAPRPHLWYRLQDQLQDDFDRCTRNGSPYTTAAGHVPQQHPWPAAARAGPAAVSTRHQLHECCRGGVRLWGLISGTAVSLCGLLDAPAWVQPRDMAAASAGVPSAWLVPISHPFVPCFPRRAVLLVARASPTRHIQGGKGFAPIIRQCHS